MRHRQQGRALRAWLRVEYLEDRNLLSVSGLNEIPAIPPGSGPGDSPLAKVAILPNDPSFGSQYALNNTGQSGGKVDADLDAPEAWNVTTGSTKNVVAIVDTGIDYRHPELYQNIWINQKEIPSAIRARLVDVDGDGLITFRDLNDARDQGAGKITDLDGDHRITAADILKPVSQGGWADGISNDGDKYVDDLIGWNFVNNTNNPLDDHGHGTHVSGIIGAMGNNGVGVAGLNWNVQLMALKFLGSNGQGLVSCAVDAINYAVAHGAFESNHSWSSQGSYYQPLADAINNARLHGHIIVAAAGNGGSDAKGDNLDASPSYPASYNYDNVVAVAATDRYDNLTTYSNYGVHTVDVAAPGQSIISTWTNGGYVTTSGTSMATPMVTGTLALVRAVHPDWSYAQIINQVTSTVDKVSALASKIASGGRVNAARAVGASAADTTGPRVVAATANASGSKPVSAVRVTFSEAVNPSTFTVNDIVSLTGPRGTLRVTGVRAVAGSGDTAFDITFDTQTAPGVYKLVLGSDIRDRAGNRMDQNRNGIRGESVADRFTASFTIDRLYTYTGRGPADINDNSRAGLTLTVDRDITISDLNVQVHLTHTNDSNLYIHLRGPDGTDVVLANRRGGNGNNYWITVFDDEAATPVSAGQAPFTGSFRPDGSLSAFDGKNARGTWTLWVEDRAAGDQGVLHYFSLMIEERVSGNGAAVTAMEETDATPSVQAASDAPSQTAASEQATSTVGNTMTSEDVVSDYFNLPGRESAPAEGGHSASSVWMSSRIVGAADTVSEMHLKRTAVDLVFTAGRGKRDARSPLLEASALSSDDLFASFEADELTTLTNTPS